LASILSERLSGTDLQSLLLEVHRRRSARRRAAEVLASYRGDRFFRPSTVSPLRLLAWEACAFAHLPAEVEPIELSPVGPLGTCSAVAPIHPDWSIATMRNSEVVSDSTNMLALECALRRRSLLRREAKSPAVVHLAARHRLLRAQRYDNPEALPHFSSLAMCSAGRDQGSRRFELAALALHIRFYLAALRSFLGTDVSLQLSLTDFGHGADYAELEGRLFSPSRARVGGVTCRMDEDRTSGRGYYSGLCFHIHAAHPSGRWLELVDGGVVDWTARLLENAKERLVISGLGSERLCTQFEGRAPAHQRADDRA